MKYWTTAELMNSGKLMREHGFDVAQLYNNGTPLPHATLVALKDLAFTLPACTSMVIVQSENCPFRRVYLKHPTQENWLALERGGWFATEDNFGFVMDALH